MLEKSNHPLISRCSCGHYAIFEETTQTWPSNRSKIDVLKRSLRYIVRIRAY